MSTELHADYLFVDPLCKLQPGPGWIALGETKGFRWDRDSRPWPTIDEQVTELMRTQGGFGLSIRFSPVSPARTYWFPHRQRHPRLSRMRSAYHRRRRGMW